MEALSTYIVDGQLGGVGKGDSVPGEYLANMFFMPKTPDMPLAPLGFRKAQACNAVAAAVEKLADGETSVKLLSGLFNIYAHIQVCRLSSVTSVHYYHGFAGWKFLLLILFGSTVIPHRFSQAYARTERD